MKRFTKIIDIAAILMLAAFVSCSSSSSSSDDNDSSKTNPAVITENTTPSNIASCVEYTYDKENFTDYKEIRTYKNDGITLERVEYFYYDAADVAGCTLGDTIKAALANDTLSFNKTTRTGRYVSIVCTVDGTTKTPVEKNYFCCECSNSDYDTILSMTFEYDNGTLKSNPSEVIFYGIVSVSDDGKTLTYTPGATASSTYKLATLCYDVSNENPVEYYKIAEWNKDKIIVVPTVETEYCTTGLTLNSVPSLTSASNIDTSMTFTFSKAPDFSYKDVTPEGATSSDKSMWYQVNRTINFFDSNGNKTTTMNTLYRLTWDKAIYNDYFILQSEYGTNSDFSEKTQRTKTVEIIPGPHGIRAYLYIYGETTQRKTSYSYSSYPKFPSGVANESTYNNIYGNNRYYVSQEDDYERASDTSLNLDKKSYTTTHYYFENGEFCNRTVEYNSSTTSVDTGSTSDTKDMTNRGLSLVAR